ncbi:hypothetical protein [Caldimonas tepidiphila]|uniref:hypothetical protein n=1 Tax=Caldimonas tepidiphila TaxID=2315841 RepID=UPI000E5ACDEB|nr:hypothetical protein [Caldimonas tepidiphila]
MNFQTSSMPVARRGAMLVLPWLLAACASYGPPRLAPGTPPEAAVEALGAPTARYQAPDGGSRLEYAHGPFGSRTWMLDYDAQGRLTGTEQVLAQPHFSRLRPGMTEREVLYAIGQPSERQRLPLQQQRLWSYRYENPLCRWFQVSLDREGRVADLGYGPDPFCDTDDSSKQ